MASPSIEVINWEIQMRNVIRVLARFRLLQWSALAWCFLAAATPASAALIGVGDIVPTTTIGPCVECLPGRVWLITEITDGTTADTPPNFNGFAGVTGVIGTIHLDLIGTFNLNSFLLWNDINVVHEGVETFRLHFFDEADALLSSSPILAAPISQLAAGQYDFASTVLGVGSVDLEVLSNLPSVHGQRIEIREVAFLGEEVPEPSTLGLSVLVFAVLGIARRRSST